VIYAGTGHRPTKLRIGKQDAYAPLVYGRLVDLAGAALRRYEPRLVISGMAEGWDQALADAALRLGLPFWAYVPHEGQEARWSADARRRYHQLLERAEKVVLVSEGPYQAYKMQRRNVAMTDDSDALLALWDGTGGGTKNCIDYATERGRPVINLWQHWLRYGPLLPYRARQSDTGASQTPRTRPGR
jgi:hypothetical protein